MVFSATGTDAALEPSSEQPRTGGTDNSSEGEAADDSTGPGADRTGDWRQADWQQPAGEERPLSAANDAQQQGSPLVCGHTTALAAKNNAREMASPADASRDTIVAKLRPSIDGCQVPVPGSIPIRKPGPGCGTRGLVRLTSPRRAIRTACQNENRVDSSIVLPGSATFGIPKIGDVRTPVGLAKSA